MDDGSGPVPCEWLVTRTGNPVPCGQPATGRCDVARLTGAEPPGELVLDLCRRHLDEMCEPGRERD